MAKTNETQATGTAKQTEAKTEKKVASKTNETQATGTAKQTEDKTEKKSGVSVLEKVGQAAIKEHGFKEVFVTSDGQVFSLENNAKNHAVNLKNRTILTVKK